MQAMPRLERSHSTRHSNIPRSGCSKCYFYSRQITTFLFSHIGLCTLLLGYAVVGAFTFSAIESKNELLQRHNVFLKRQETIRNLSIMTNESLIYDAEEWGKKARVILADFEASFVKSVRVHGFDGVATSEPENIESMINKQWSFSGALLYSIIVITTIGYGNVAPRTELGKITTILYAIIGIPLMLFCLSNIGYAMAHSFKFIYWKCCNNAKEKEHRRRMRKKRRIARQQKRAAMLASQMNSYCGDSGNMIFGCLPANRYLNTNQTSLQPQTLMTNQYMHQLPQLSSNGTGNQTTSIYVPSSGPHSATPTMHNDGQTIFFNHSSAEFEDAGPPTQSTTLNNSNLGRSLSARYYGENKAHKQRSIQQNFQRKQLQLKNQRVPSGQQSQQKQHLQQQFSPYLSPVLPPVTLEPLDKNPLSSVICNRYASLSDECIPTRLELDDRLDCSVAPNIKLSIPPRRTQSQVRFQRPTIITRQRHESIYSPDFANVSQPPVLSTPLPYTFNGNNQPIALPMSGDDSNQFYYEDQSSSVFASNYAMGNGQPPVPYSDLISEAGSNIDNSDSDDDEKMEKNIPIKVCFMLVVGYICGGAWFFSVSENWTFLDASYFCFVTLSTIGFGDLVPGRTVLLTSPEESQVTRAVCALYLLFGMALLAMSLNLIKEKVTETVKSIGERIGLLVSDEEDDDYY